jgi:hypothetical protein
MAMIRARLQELRTRWRRWRLLRAYARVFKVRTGKRVGFTPLMAAYEQAERDDVLELVDGKVYWHYPNNTKR